MTRREHWTKIIEAARDSVGCNDPRHGATCAERHPGDPTEWCSGCLIAAILAEEDAGRV